MSRNRFRIGSIAVLFAVVVLCVAIFGVLTVSSAVSDRRAAERYGEHVEVLYACENAGQDWLSEADAYLKGAGDLPENTEETETTLKTEIMRGNMQLEICLNMSSTARRCPHRTLRSMQSGRRRLLKLRFT